MGACLFGGVVALNNVETGERRHARVLISTNPEEHKLTYTIAPISGEAIPIVLHSCSAEVCDFFEQIGHALSQASAATA